MPNSWPGIRPRHQVLIGASIGLLVLVGSFSYDKWSNYKAEIARTEDAVRQTSALLSRHTARVFDGIDSALREVVRLRLEAEQEGMNSQSAHRILKAVHGGSPVLQTIGLVNRYGTRTSTSYSADPPAVNISSSTAFKTLRDLDTDESSTFVSKPFFSSILQSNTIFVAHRMTDSEGEFSGLAYGLVDPLYFSQVFQAADLGLNAVVTLLRQDGAILVRFPADGQIPDPDSAEPSFPVETIGRAVSGTLRVRGTESGDARIVGFGTTDDRRFVLTTSVRIDQALETFYDELVVGLWRLGLAIFLLCGIALALIAQIRRREVLGNRLRDSERRFRDFAEASGDWFWETDADHRIIWMSKAVAQASGTPSEWHMGKRRIDMCATHLMADPEAILNHQETLNRHEPFSDFEYPRKAPGGVRWIRTSGLPIFNEDGAFVGYRGSARDISDFVDAKERLKDATDALPGGFMLFNAADELIYKNAPSQQPTGVGTVERIGDTFETILRASIAQGMVEEAKDDPEAWLRWRMERHWAANSTTLVHINGRAIEVVERPTSDGGRIVLRFDVTDREMAYEEIRRARDDANAANQAKSDFLASMSHELRTPLNAIIGFGEILQRTNSRKLTEEQMREYSGYIVSSGQLLLNLVSDVLDLSSIESGYMKVDLRSISVRSMIDRAVESVRPLADQRSIDLQIDVSKEAGNVHADSQRGIQVLLNLLSNAIKYNRPKGLVRVQVEEDGGQITILVTDSGPGIAPEKASRLFAPFDRLGAEFGNIEGTGIGLALSRRLVSAMSGQIGYYPADPSGSTFWLSLPRSAEAETTVRSTPRQTKSEDQQVGGFKILCIEDNPINLRIVEHVVASLPDVTFLESMTGIEGLERARSHLPDVIVLDLNLPDISGYEVLSRLASDPRTSGIPVIALTASAMNDQIERGLEQGFFRYLTKPLDFSEFVAALRDAVQSGRSGRPDSDNPRTRDTVADAAPDAAPESEPDGRGEPDGGPGGGPGSGSEAGAGPRGETDTPVIDTARLSEIRSVAPDDTFVKLVTALCDEINRRADRFGATLASDDLQSVASDMHALKGQCLNMGASALANLASRLSDNALNSDRPALEQARAEFEMLSATTVAQLSHHLDTVRRSTVSAA